MLRRRHLLLSPAAIGFPAVLATVGGPVAWGDAVELARGRGVRGPWRQNESTYDFVDDPSVAFAADGSLVVAWVDQARKAVHVQRRTRAGRPDGEPVEIGGPDATFSWMPRLAVPPDAPSSALVLWQEIIFSGGSHGGEMLLARLTQGARGSGALANLSSSRGGDGKGRITPEVWHNGSHDLRAAAGGAVLAAWTEYDGPLWLARSADGGRTFAAPQRIAGGRGEHPARAPSVAFAGDGAVLAAWTHGDVRAARIQVARSGGWQAAFGAALSLPSEGGYADAPRLAVAPDGTVHAAWSEAAGGPFGRPRVLHARSNDGGRSFGRPQVVVDRLRPPHVGAGYPSLGVDARGSVVVLAELFEDPRERPRGLCIAVSRDGGASFGQPAVVPGSRDPGGGFNGSSQGLLVPKLAVHADGAIAVVNSALREGSHSRVWLLPGRVV